VKNPIIWSMFFPSIHVQLCSYVSPTLRAQIPSGESWTSQDLGSLFLFHPFQIRPTLLRLHTNLGLHLKWPFWNWNLNRLLKITKSLFSERNVFKIRIVWQVEREERFSYEWQASLHKLQLSKTVAVGKTSWNLTKICFYWNGDAIWLVCFLKSNIKMFRTFTFYNSSGCN